MNDSISFDTQLMRLLEAKWRVPGTTILERGTVTAELLDRGAWVPLPYAAGWADLAGFAESVYRKDAQGVVHLRGAVTKTAGTPANLDLIATLPVGFRPVTGGARFAVATGPAANVGHLAIGVTGNLRWIAGGTTETDFMSLDGITFWTE